MHQIKRFSLLFLTAVVAAFFSLSSLALSAPADRLTVSGAFVNPQKKPVKEVEIEVLVNGQAVRPLGKDAEISSGSKGAFSAQFELPPGTLPAAKVEVKAFKPSWEPFPPAALKIVEAVPRVGVQHQAALF